MKTFIHIILLLVVVYFIAVAYEYMFDHKLSPSIDKYAQIPNRLANGEYGKVLVPAGILLIIILVILGLLYMVSPLIVGGLIIGLISCMFKPEESSQDRAKQSVLTRRGQK